MQLELIQNALSHFKDSSDVTREKQASIYVYKYKFVGGRALFNLIKTKKMPNMSLAI